MRLAQQLRSVDLLMLATDADRRSVVTRLRREGIDNAMELILLTEEEVMGWWNVGPVFLTILAEMRHEVVEHPERIVDTWRFQHRLFILPDDLDLQKEQHDFFGMLMAAEDEVTYGAADESVQNAPSPRKAVAAREQHVSGASEHAFREIERCLIAAIEMLEKRWDGGAVLRKYYLDGLSVQNIVSTLGLASSASLYRIVNTHFSHPLLKGYSVKGVEFSDKLIKSIVKLRKELVYTSAVQLEVLERIVPSRFLEFIGLTLLQQTTAENFWGGDYIVRQGEVERCRRTQRDLFSSLQFRVVAGKESAIRRSIQMLRQSNRRTTCSSTPVDVNFLRVLLKGHPCVETDKKGYRLVSERLNYDCVRIARIVYDAHGPITLDQILAQYERRYMQRPRSLSIANVRVHFPQVHSVRRGVWEWK